MADQLGVDLRPRRVEVGDGRWLELDAAPDDLSVLCEAWAHQGPTKPAQRNKVVSDAFKLLFVAGAGVKKPRLVLLLSDEIAAKPFRGRSWYAAALERPGFEIIVVALPPEIRRHLERIELKLAR